VQIVFHAKLTPRNQAGATAYATLIPNTSGRFAFSPVGIFPLGRHLGSDNVRPLSMKNRSKTLIFAALFFAAGVVCAAQKPIKVDVDLVMVNVSVTNSENNLVRDLTADHFQLFEDRVEQKIKYFSSEVAPMSLGIVFDVSQSMKKKLDFAKAAAVRFLETGTLEDEYFLVEFSNRAQIAQNFTTDITRLRDRLAFKPAQGETALYDAVYLALAEVKAGQNPKKALLLITDGEDNHSRYSRGDVRELLRESDVQIYVIDLGRALLGDLAEMTGGRSYRTSVENLEETCEKIAQEIKSQYVLGYESTNTSKDGKFRKVRVRTAAPAGMPRLHVRAREGYYAPHN
jgi:Ca-activated chloride channel family protein